MCNFNNHYVSFASWSHCFLLFSYMSFGEVWQVLAGENLC